jgi:hypothetical protein
MKYYPLPRGPAKQWKASLSKSKFVLIHKLQESDQLLDCRDDCLSLLLKRNGKHFDLSSSARQLITPNSNKYDEVVFALLEGSIFQIRISPHDVSLIDENGNFLCTP